MGLSTPPLVTYGPLFWKVPCKYARIHTGLRAHTVDGHGHSRFEASRMQSPVPGVQRAAFNDPTPALAANFLPTLHWKRHRAASCSFKMISFSNINKQYGKQLLFVDASFQLNPGEKVGLVGPNGAGKTTLFR